MFQKEEELEAIAPPQKIIRELFSIEEKIAEITGYPDSGWDYGSQLFRAAAPGYFREEVVVTLLALLEMVKISGLRLLQNRVFIDFQIHREVKNNEQ